MTNQVYKGDLPDDLDLGPVVAIDCETMGLNPKRDRLCVVQLSTGDGNAHLVQVSKGQKLAPNLCHMLEDPNVLKLFHFRTYTDRHGLKNLLQELLAVDISKQQQSSDWGAKRLSKAQVEYAASDVLYLHQLRESLNQMLVREGRMEVAQSCFDFLPTRAQLDLAGWPDTDIFAHS